MKGQCREVEAGCMSGRARRNGAVLTASKSRELLPEDVGRKYLMEPRESCNYRRQATVSRTRPLL